MGVITARAQPLSLQQTLPGRAVPFEVSEVRPQVGGLVRQRLFTEGQQVKAGQLLYQIDPAPYQAAFDTARGQLAQAEASVLSAQPRPSAPARCWAWMRPASRMPTMPPRR